MQPKIKINFILLFVAVAATLSFGQEREGYSYLGHQTIRPFVETYTTKADGYQGWGVFGTRLAVVRGIDVFPDDPITTSEMRPRRREA